ncbi:MAG: nucleotidyltransferase family protein [Oscillospiraceae bacterium]|jgi:hypothetical protein|nr:nucleotidyltransferase family protein [Oscillospiraceae bacterium]
MNDTSRAFLALLEAAIHAHEPPPMPDGLDWVALYRLAAEHRVDGMLLAPALQASQPPSGALLTQWQQRAMAVTMRQFQIVDTLHTTLAVFEEANLRAVVLKGVVLKALYPEPDLRVMSDADLLVESGEFDRAKSLLTDQGYQEITEDSHEDTFVCVHPDGLRIELHNRLFDRKNRGFLARLDEGALFPVSKAVRAEAYGGECWTLPVGEHALFQLLHMAKHMITTGFGLRQACDFTLFIEANDSAIDWVWCRKQCETLDLLPFQRALLTLCRDHLGLSDGAWQSVMTGGSPKSDEETANGLLADILDAGVFGKSTAERTRSAAVVYRSFDGAEGERDSRWRSLARAVFIRRDELHPPYLYAKEHGFLLPIAWAHRLFRYAFIDRLKGAESGAGFSVARERMALLDRLGMLK